MRRQFEEEVVHPEEELPDLVQVSPEQADNRSIRGRAERPCSLRQLGQPLLVEPDRGRRRAQFHPHHLLQRGLEILEHLFIALHQRKTGLLEIEGSLFLDGDQSAVIRVHMPVSVPPHRLNERRDLTPRAVRQDPVPPIRRILCEPPSKFDDVHVEPIEHLRLHDSQLLDEIVHVDIPRGDPEVLLQPGIRDRHNTRGPMSGEINRNPIRPPVFERGDHPFSRRHSCLPDSVRPCAVYTSLYWRVP